MSQEIKGNNILIAGFGREGKSVLKYIESLPDHYNITVADLDPLALKDISYPTLSGSAYLDTARSFDTVIHAPGISKKLPQLQDVANLTTATNIFFSVCPGKIIGITGTKGKSTTSALIHHLLSSNLKDVKLVGNIGNPALSELPAATKDTIFVMELSSYQLDDIGYSPQIAVVLPISQEHLPYHGSFKSYAKAKANITRFQSGTDYLVYADGNEPVYQISLQSPAIIIPFSTIQSRSHHAWVGSDGIYTHDNQRQPELISNLDKLPLLGQANYTNILASITVSKLLNVPNESIKSALSTFKPLAHRLEYVTTINQTSFYNDSLATTPEATIHALEALPNTSVLITGGFDRDLDYTNLGTSIAKSNISSLILFPETGHRILNAVNQANIDRRPISIIHTSSMHDAVSKASKAIKPHETCLLSPASASFNLFKDYADRGNQFKKAVTELSLV